MPSSMLFAVNNEGRVFGLSTNGTKWREFPYLGLDFKSISAIPNFLWAVGGDRQIYVHVHGLDIPIRIKEESFENQRWLPIEGFSSRLLPTDRHNYSTEDGLQERPLEKIRVPSMAWQWEGDWKIETVMNGEPLDHDGWTYAMDFPSTYHSTKQWTSCVRRRKWVRTRRYIAMNSWCAVAPLHKDPTREPFIDVSIGGQLMAEERQGALQVWAVTAHGRVMWRKDVSLTCPEGTKWQAVSLPAGCEVRCISCGATGLVWGVLWSGKAVVRTKITPNTPMGEEWVEVDSPEDSTTKLVQVCVGHNSVWAVTSDKRVWFRKGVKSDPNSSADLAKGSGWVEMVGNMNMVSVAPNDQVFAVGTDDRSLYFRVGVTPAELTGKRWRCLNASVCMSRASSVTSSCSNLHRSRRSTLSLQNTMGSVEECEWSESSRSAPTSLKIIPDWQKGTQPSSLPASEGSIEEPSMIHMANGSVPTAQRPSRKLTAWSPIRSVGSLIGLEANPFTDPEAEFDGIVHPEREVPTDCDPGWYQADTLWSGVEAGALDLNPAHMPKWFLDADFSDGLEKASWRNKMLCDLRNNNVNVSKKFDSYEVAVEMTSCVKTVECRCALFGSSVSPFDECLLELEWVGNKCSTVDTASLSVFNLDKSHMRCQLSMAEIVCITSSSEPGAPRISIYTRESAVRNESLLRLQFVCDNDHDEWMAYLSYVHAAIGELEGSPGVSSIWALTNLGDVYVFSTESLQKQQYSGGLFSSDLKCSNAIGTEWTHQLNNGFPQDSCVTVAGFIPKNVERFSVNLDVNSDKNVALHVNPRFDDNCIVRNSKENEEWGNEEKEGLLTLTQGGDFEIKILCLREGFKVSINGIVFTYFEHRLSPHSITHVRVSGGVELQKVTYDSKEVILPLEEMVWKQVGGHMKVVETCSAGVTWGISSDNVPYAYTGGWGGQFLNCLQKSESGIHGMTDHCVLDVWENQRWNPLSGFSARGLPTDRPMWSDITGFHKRAKETTRLLSKHWQWINDWSIDFQAPGGVDSDGWQYAIDFSTSYHPNKGMADIVRRRRWIRTCKLTTSGPWAEVGNSKVIDISLQDSTGLDTICVWAVSAKGDALYRKGVTKSNPVGESWEHVACSELLESISCGCSNQVWASTKTGSSYWRFGISTSNPKGDVWEIVEPPKGALIRKVSVARWAVWALDRDGKVYVRREVTPVFPEGTHWQSISTPDFEIFKDVSASGDEVWAITSSGTLVRRLGVSCENPAGYCWSNGLSANWRYISARSYTSKTMPQKR